MQLQGRNLKLHMQGDDIKLLQDGLRQLGYPLPLTETDRTIFGPATEQAVRDFQGHHNLPPTGVVDEACARRINEAVAALPSPEPGLVQGIVRLENGQPLAGATVKAFDKDLRREKPLGIAITDNQGAYRIPYTATRLARAEKKCADLLVRVYSKTGALLGASAVKFNAGQTETVDLVVPPPPAEPEPAEYGQLLAALAPVLQELPPAELNADDIQFLLNELAGVPMVNPRRLDLLAQGARLANATHLPPQFFYAIARQRQLPLPLTLDAFLSLDAASARQALVQAGDAHIIAALDKTTLDGVVVRFEQVKLQHGHLVPRTVRGRLINAATNAPLAGYTVRAQPSSWYRRSKRAGARSTNKRGLFSFTLYTLPQPRSGEPAQPPDRLLLTILNAQRAQIHQVEFDLQPAQVEVLEVKVPAQALPQPTVHPIRDVAATLNLPLPAALTPFLAQQNVHTLEDIRQAGGVSYLKNLPVAVDDPGVKALDAHANLSLLSADVRTRATLIEKGFSSIRDVAAAPQTSFMRATAESLGMKQAAQLHVMATAQSQLLDNVLAGIGADLASGLKTKIFNSVIEKWASDEIRTIFTSKCDCADCESAVSPLAYLADLLDYAVNHVKKDGEAITLHNLAGWFHQPFDDLPASCEAVEERVRQVRLCVEVLRSYLGDHTPSVAEQEYLLETYTTLLTKLGTSHVELRLAPTADQKTRAALAQRLGFEDPDHLDELHLAPQQITEETLERLFGLIDTRRDPLSKGAKQRTTDHGEQITRWKFAGVAWNQNTDAAGNVYVRLSHPTASSYLVEVFRNKSRGPESLVASGSISRSTGTVALHARNNSRFSGVVDIAYTAFNDDIIISAIPQLLSWRLEYLRTLWQATDRPLDPYMADPGGLYSAADLLPIIDPDVIGVDDFRTPFAKTIAGVSEHPFELWVKRRTWVDERLAALRNVRIEELAEPEKPRDEQILNAILGKLREPVLYETESATPWPPTPSFDEFRIIGVTLAQGRDVEALCHRIQHDLKLTLESFNWLTELQTKARTQEGLAEDEWEDLYSILVQAQKNTFIPKWREEEQSLESRVGRALLSPWYFWLSLSESIEGVWPPLPVDNRPVIDPELVDRKSLPDPTAGRRAQALLEARRAKLAEFYAALKTAHEPGGPAGFDAMLESALGVCPSMESGGNWQTYLTALRDRLQAAEARGDPDEIARVTAEVTGLYMTTVNLKRIIEVQGKSAASPAEWAEVYALLTSSRKEREGWLTAWRARRAGRPGDPWSILAPPQSQAAQVASNGGRTPSLATGAAQSQQHTRHRPGSDQP